MESLSAKINKKVVNNDSDMQREIILLFCWSASVYGSTDKSQRFYMAGSNFVSDLFSQPSRYYLFVASDNPELLTLVLTV